MEDSQEINNNKNMYALNNDNYDAEKGYAENKYSDGKQRRKAKTYHEVILKTSISKNNLQ